jgi:hypothetical protein
METGEGTGGAFGNEDGNFVRLFLVLCQCCLSFGFCWIY